MTLLINHYETKLNLLDVEIQRILGSSASIFTLNSYPNRESALQQHLKQFNTDVISKKQIKFMQDQYNYNKGKAYT